MWPAGGDQRKLDAVTLVHHRAIQRVLRVRGNAEAIQSFHLVEGCSRYLVSEMQQTDAKVYLNGITIKGGVCITHTCSPGLSWKRGTTVDT